MKPWYALVGSERSKAAAVAQARVLPGIRVSPAWFFFFNQRRSCRRGTWKHGAVCRV